MDIKSLITFVLDPKLLAIAGGYLSYHYLGKKKEGFERYAYAGGGAVAGYFAGYLAQKFLKPAPPPEPSRPQVAPPVSEYDVLDLDATPVPQRRALPPPSPAPPQTAAQPTPPPPETVDVRGAGSNDSALLYSLGSYEGTGEDGLGSYEPSLDGDVDVDAALRDAGFKRPGN